MFTYLVPDSLNARTCKLKFGLMPHTFGPEYTEKESCGKLLKLRVGNKGNLKPLKVVILTVCKCGRCLFDTWVCWLYLCYLIKVIVFSANPEKCQAPFNTKGEGVMGLSIKDKERHIDSSFNLPHLPSHTSPRAHALTRTHARTHSRTHAHTHTHTHTHTHLSLIHI